MSTPHMPSCPTTSYKGDLRTKNSSVAFAAEWCQIYRSQKRGERVRTETVERRADEHEDIAFGAIEGGPVLVRELVRGDEHAEPADADEDALRDGRS